MKQHITGDDLHQLKLNDVIAEKMDKLFHAVPEEERNYSLSHVIRAVDTGIEYRFPLLSIGQMIAFLVSIYGKRVDMDQMKDYKNPKSEWHVEVKSMIYIKEELCDALWEATKETLNSLYATI